MEQEILEELKYRWDHLKFIQIKELAHRFQVQYSRPLVGDAIFRIIQSYVQRNKRHIEILRVPISDSTFQGFTIIRKGVLFQVINTCQPLSEQIFAAAYQLYEIVCYIEKNDTNLIERGSLVFKDKNTNPEALTFAALVLAPETEILSQMELFGIEKTNISIKEIVYLMDCFGIAYDIMVLRLYESKIIEANRTTELLSKMIEAEQFIKDTGIAIRWKYSTKNDILFGNLPILLKKNKEQGLLPAEIILRDKKRMDEIKKLLLEKL